MSYNLISAFAAFFAWGGWAYYINSSAGKLVGLVSALAQGTLSFVITLIVVIAVTRFYGHLQPGVWRIWLPAIAVVGALSVVMSSAHYLVGTPHIVSTITPSLSITFLFCVYTAHRLSHTE